MTISTISIIPTDLQGKRSLITRSLSDIAAYASLVKDAGVLDHVQAKLLPVVASLQAHLEEAQGHCEEQKLDFVVTEKFAPTQKNEKQLTFHKVNTPRKSTTQFHFKYVYTEVLYHIE